MMTPEDMYLDLKGRLTGAFQQSLQLHQVSDNAAYGFIGTESINAVISALLHACAQSLAAIQAGLELGNEVENHKNCRDELADMFARVLKREFIGDLERNEQLRKQHYVKSKQ